MYAHDQYSVLLVFQAMDAAGKDSTIQHVMSGINPHGVEVHAFKRPSERELDHTYLWRTNRQMPPRGRIGIFNRSYYEEVLVARVHPSIVTSIQKLPDEHHEDLDQLWERRFHDIRNMEDYNFHNGMRIVKFYLTFPKTNNRRRFLRRLNKPSKHGNSRPVICKSASIGTSTCSTTKSVSTRPPPRTVPGTSSPPTTRRICG